MRRLLAPLALGVANAALLFSTAALPAQAAGPAACILSLNQLDVQVAFMGSSRTVACQAALKQAGPTASIGYDAPAGQPACVVLYEPGDPNLVNEGAIVFDSGSGQASKLCGVYSGMDTLYVYDLQGHLW